MQLTDCLITLKKSDLMSSLRAVTNEMLRAVTDKVIISQLIHLTLKISDQSMLESKES